jgi:hypothetical protein
MRCPPSRRSKNRGCGSPAPSKALSSPTSISRVSPSCIVALAAPAEGAAATRSPGGDVATVPSLGETQMRPTAMLFRNLAAMTVEELLRANPVDGAVLLGGCDKTIPALRPAREVTQVRKR